MKESPTRSVDRQKREEREGFERFLCARDIRLDPGKLQQPDPPYPDILYPMPDEGLTAFELVEIRDERSTRRLDIRLTAEKFLRENRQRLPQDVRAALGALSVSVGFRNDKSALKIRSAVLELAHLVARDSYRSTETFRSVSILKECVHYLHVRSNESLPAGIHVSSVSPYGDPIIARVTKKLRTKYVSECPIELLAWYGSQGGETFEIHRREQLADIVRDNGGCRPFRRLWVFSSPRERILALYPELDAAWLGVSVFRHGL